MAANPIPGNFKDLFHLSGECLAGAIALGGSIPLVLNTGGSIGSDRNNAIQLHADFRDGLAGLPVLRASLVTARSNARAFATKTRNWLENTLGSKHNLGWTAVGFDHNSLEIPTDDSGLEALLARMHLYLGKNPSQENPDPKVNVTAARADTIGKALTSAVNALNGKDSDLGTRKSGRDNAVRALRRRMSGLISELGQVLDDNDPRWRRFGLNKPGAPNVPVVPNNVAVNANTPGELFITCAASKYATHYRFFTQRLGVDLEPVFAGRADAPMIHLTHLKSGQSYEVLVTAANAGAESRFSGPVTATVKSQEAAAA